MNSGQYGFKWWTLAVAVVVLFAWCATDLSAQGTTTGKISGRVLDAKTKESLPGATVAVEGTRLGAITDADGEYVILGLHPGTHTLKISIVGYATQTVAVPVVTDRTASVNVEMSVEAIELEEIEVLGTRPVVETDISFTQQILGSDLITKTPIPSQRLADLLRTLPGVDFNSWGITIRGQTQQDIAFIQDGVKFNPRMYQNPFAQYAKSSTQEIQVLTGGFMPEYGQARAGVVNIVSKDPKEWMVSADLRLSRPGGGGRYGPNTFTEDYWQATRYLSDVGTGDRDGDGVEDFEGWNNWITRTTAEGTNTFEGQSVLTKEQARAIWLYQHRQVSWDGNSTTYIDGTNPGVNDPQGQLNLDPDQLPWPRSIDASIGGPLIRNYVNFLYTYREERIPYITYAAQPFSESKLHQARLMFTPTLNTKLTLMLIRATGNYNGYERNNGSSDNTVLRGTNWSGSQTPLTRGNNKLWAGKHGTNINRRRDTQFGASWRHALSARTFYEASLTGQRVAQRNQQAPIMDSRGVVAVHTDGHIELYPGLASDTPLSQSDSGGSPFYPDTPERQAWADEQQGRGAVTMTNGPNGWVNPNSPNRDILGVHNIGNFDANRRTGSTWSRQADFNIAVTTQLARRHEVKGGASVQFSDGFQADGTVWGHEFQFMANRQHWSGAAFLQDKMEYNQLVVFLGGRLDWDKYAKHEDFHFWDPNDPRANWFWGDTRRGGYDASNFDVEKTKPSRVPPVKAYLAPRLGLSYPITVTSKVYFNYGYFFRAPNMLEMYALYQGEGGGTIPVYIGNPYNRALRVLQYELGYEQGFLTGTPGSFKFTGVVYFKDSVRDHYSRFVGFRAPPGRFAGWRPDVQNNLADYRGFELSLARQGGQWWNGSTSMNLEIAKNQQVHYSGMGFDQTVNPFKEGRLYASGRFDGANVEGSGGVDVRPVAKAFVSLYSPSRYVNNPALGGWDLSFQYYWKRGGGFNYNPTSDPDLRGERNARWIAERWINMDVSKQFIVGDFRPAFYFSVSNLFDWPFPLATNGPGQMFQSDTDGRLGGQGASFTNPRSGITKTNNGARQEKMYEEHLRRGGAFGSFIGSEGDTEFNNFMPLRWWTGYSNKRDVHFGVRIDL